MCVTETGDSEIIKKEEGNIECDGEDIDEDEMLYHFRELSLLAASCRHWKPQVVYT
jgi:hypothetical protein